MKKILFAAALIAVSAFAFAPAAMATPAIPNVNGIGVNTALYHSYDGLICADCHTMHYSEDGVAPTDAVGGPNQKLLKKNSNTDICLSCHQENHNTSATALLNTADSGWTAPLVMTAAGGGAPAGYSMPAGDFYYSKLASANGHNPAWTGSNTSVNIQADTVFAGNPPAAPGLSITWTEPDWDCHSCHGMHNRFSGSYGPWRQLKRKFNGIINTGDEGAGTVETTTGNKGATTTGYTPISSNSRGDIVGTSYLAVRPDGAPLDGADLFATYSSTNQNVYRDGFSSYCSVCHGDFHGGTEQSTGDTGGAPTSSNGNTSGSHWLRHPTNVSMNIANGHGYGVKNYTKQVLNSDGNAPNPAGYDWKYPLARVNGTWTADGTDNAVDPNGSDKVMCMTCHFAHAGPNANALRWDEATQVAFIAKGGVDSYGETSIGDNPAYGCNKCHQKGGSVAYIKTGF